MRPWEELREELKESNRKQGDDISNKLRGGLRVRDNACRGTNRPIRIHGR
jgi:hypothetical protein